MSFWERDVNQKNQMSIDRFLMPEQTKETNTMTLMDNILLYSFTLFNLAVPAVLLI